MASLFHYNWIRELKGEVAENFFLNLNWKLLKKLCNKEKYFYFVDINLSYFVTRLKLFTLHQKEYNILFQRGFIFSMKMILKIILVMVTMCSIFTSGSAILSCNKFFGADEHHWRKMRTVSQTSGFILLFHHPHKIE